MDLKEWPGRDFQRHPWETARANFFLKLLHDHVSADGFSVLDVGSGDGFFARRLLAQFPKVSRLTCFDLGYDAAWLASAVDSPRGPFFTATKPQTTFDLILMLDVLEHIQDDEATLNEVATTWLKPGGWLLLSVPAWQGLFSDHDEMLGHQRRYAPAALHALVNAAKLTTVARGELFSSLLLSRGMAKLREIVRSRIQRSPANGPPPKSLGQWTHGPRLTSAVVAALSFDTRCSHVAARLGLPWAGLSTWVLAKRHD
jgi:2-polyprenyl-3-methyl-5-hydroxy-6-metoxy-1,4-benzoquinol methylase